MLECLKKHFAELGLSESASEWLLSLWQVSQFFDDVADGDTPSRQELDSALWHCLVSIPHNTFYQANAQRLAPLVTVAILKWQASDKAEREGMADARSYMYRAGYYDLVMMALLICRGPEVAHALSADIMRMYGESYDEYKKEFDNA